VPFDTFLQEVEQCGVILEEMVDPKGQSLQQMPSVQLYIQDVNKVQVLSSHEQLMNGCIYLGCRYPACEQYLETIMRYAGAAGETLAKKGVRGFLGVDFLATQNENGEWDIIALEINIRLCATTFAYFSLLTVVDEQVVSKKHYLMLDELLLREPFTLHELEREVSRLHLRFDWRTGRGALFASFSGLASHRRVSLMVIADSKPEVDAMLGTFLRELASPEYPAHAALLAVADSHAPENQTPRGGSPERATEEYGSSPKKGGGAHELGAGAQELGAGAQ